MQFIIQLEKFVKFDFTLPYNIVYKGNTIMYEGRDAERILHKIEKYLKDNHIRYNYTIMN